MITKLALKCACGGQIVCTNVKGHTFRYPKHPSGVVTLKYDFQMPYCSKCFLHCLSNKCRKEFEDLLTKSIS